MTTLNGWQGGDLTFTGRQCGALSARSCFWWFLWLMLWSRLRNNQHTMHGTQINVPLWHFIKFGTKTDFALHQPRRFTFPLADVLHYPEWVFVICVLLSILPVVSIPLVAFYKFMCFLKNYTMNRQSKSICKWVLSWGIVNRYLDLCYLIGGQDYK